jgi:tetratricopeptide (TPR) repeat protein
VSVIKLKSYFQSFWIYILPALIVLGGCSSTHNLKTDGNNPLGGGFADEELQPGLYQLTARGNMAPWPSFGAAKTTWERRAEQLCGKGAYQEILEARDAGLRGETLVYLNPGQMVLLPKYNAAISGYILCNSSAMTPEQAIKYVNDIPAIAAKEASDRNKSELEKLGGSECSESAPKVTAETYFGRGKILVAMNDYKAAMACLMRAQEEEKDTQVYRDSCTQIATMYELGWGVDKDIEMSKAWLKKAGL